MKEIKDIIKTSVMWGIIIGTMVSALINVEDGKNVKAIAPAILCLAGSVFYGGFIVAEAINKLTETIKDRDNEE